MPTSRFIDGLVNPYNQTPRGTRDDIEDDYIMEDEFCFYRFPDDIVVYVADDESGRPDKIAYRTLGNPLFDWIVMRRNGIHFPDEIKAGMMLYVPRMSRLTSSGSPLSP